MTILSVVAVIDRGEITQYNISEDTGDAVVLYADYRSYRETGLPVLSLMIELDAWFDIGNEPSIYVIERPPVPEPEEPVINAGEQLVYESVNFDAANTIDIGPSSERIVALVSIKINAAFDKGSLASGDSSSTARYQGGVSLNLKQQSVGDVISYTPYVQHNEGEQSIITYDADGATTGNCTVYIHYYE